MAIEGGPSTLSIIEQSGNGGYFQATDVPQWSAVDQLVSGVVQQFGRFEYW
jgi:hypothetical protein